MNDLINECEKGKKGRKVEQKGKEGRERERVKGKRKNEREGQELTQV